MQLSVTGHHIDLTDALRNYVSDKFERLERHFDHVQNVHVILTVEKLRHKAEASMNISGSQVFADSVENDMYAAVDVLVDKLDRQIVRHKEKMKNHHRNHNEGAHRNLAF